MVALAYALAAAVTAYWVTRLEVGPPVFELPGAFQSEHLEVSTAIAYFDIQSYLTNAPILARKGRFVKRGITGLALSFAPLAAIVIGRLI